MLVKVQEKIVRWAYVEVPDEELDVVSTKRVEPTAEGHEIIYDQVFDNWDFDVLEVDFYNADEE